MKGKLLTFKGCRCWNFGESSGMFLLLASVARVMTDLCQSETIRVLVWVLSFMSFGYATGEFEVTAERLGVYRPEEHIDNPKDYADNEDARKYDPRLRGPVSEAELAVDPNTGMISHHLSDFAFIESC